jgi:hypothetical protein
MNPTPRILAGIFGGMAAFAATLAADITPADAVARLRVAMQLARERNDQALVDSVDRLGREFRLGLPPDADARLMVVEESVGIDPGGWSIAGQPLFHPTREMEEELRAVGPRLDAAMRLGDAGAVRGITAAMLELLGDQAGVPDGRRPGRAAEPHPMTEAEAADLFLDALQSKGSSVREMTAGKPLPDQMLRVYADMLAAVVGIRPFVAKHRSDALGEIDGLAGGLAKILMSLQQAAGHFPFPDLRGKNIRFGGMIQRRVDAGQAEARDGWILSVEPGGGTQFDTGLCGIALLLAGDAYGNAEWSAAGLRAAGWALAQPCCANFNYNAFSVSLLARAFRVTGETKYRDGAWQKFRVGVAPGQAPNGRWMDPHNARTVYHVILLRGVADLGGIAAPEDRGEVDAVARPAIKALLGEFDAMGITVEALPELLALADLYPDDGRLAKAVRVMAGSIVAKCTDDQRARMGAAPVQIAALPRVAP